MADLNAEAILTINTERFEESLRQVSDTVYHNTAEYAKQFGQKFLDTARSEAPWKNHKGVARAGFVSKVEYNGGGVVMLSIGGSAPNYKKGPRSVADYMEYLEFDHDKEYAIIYPLVSSICGEIRRNFGRAALTGYVPVRIKRDRMHARIRERRYRARNHRQYGVWNR